MANDQKTVPVDIKTIINLKQNLSTDDVKDNLVTLFGYEDDALRVKVNRVYKKWKSLRRERRKAFESQPFMLPSNREPPKCVTLKRQLMIEKQKSSSLEKSIANNRKERLQYKRKITQLETEKEALRKRQKLLVKRASSKVKDKYKKTGERMTKKTVNISGTRLANLKEKESQFHIISNQVTTLKKQLSEMHQRSEKLADENVQLHESLTYVEALICDSTDNTIYFYDEANKKFTPQCELCVMKLLDASVGVAHVE